MEFDTQPGGSEGLLTAQTCDFEDYCVIEDFASPFKGRFIATVLKKNPTDVF